MNTRLLKKLYLIKKLSIAQKSYFLAFILLGITIAISVMYLVKAPPLSLIITFLFLSFAAAIFGFTAELNTFYKKIWPTIIGKVGIAIFSILITNTSLDLSYQLVSSVIQAPPDKFTLTISSLTIILIKINWVSMQIYRWLHKNLYKPVVFRIITMN